MNHWRLIVGSGSITSDWELIDQEKLVAEALAEPVNPFTQTRKEISRLARLTLPDIFYFKTYDKVYYYGAGCSNPERRLKVEQSLTTQFRSPVTAYPLILGCARGLLQDVSGIQCILANHSSACLYDGKMISDLSMSAGYLLGDEGSAVALGRMFLADVMRSIAPRAIADDFMVKYKVLSNNDLRDLVYQHPDIEKLLVSVALFLKDYKKHSYVKALVLKNFKDFFVRCVMRYDDYKNLPFSAVGHMAYDFRAELKEVAKEYNVKVVHAVEVKPMTGLVQYHLNHPEV